MTFSVTNQEVLVGTADGLSEAARGLFWDNATSRLGVGTNAPTDEVHVYGTIRADHFKGSAAGLTGLTAKQLSGTISVACGGTGRTFLESGKVLVGSGLDNVESAEGLTWTAPLRTLDVHGTVRAHDFSGMVQANDILGTLSADNIPCLDASIVSSGTLNGARIPQLNPSQIPALDASFVASGTLHGARIPQLNPSQIPALDASFVATGTLVGARIPLLNASQIPQLNLSQVPALDASFVASGLLDAACVPALNASFVATGTLNGAQIPQLNPSQVPALDASFVATGTLNGAQIPQLNPSQVPALDASFVSSGILPVVYGGTGRLSFDSECVLVGNGSKALGVAQGVLVRDGHDVHARTFHGSGSGLSDIPAAKLSGVVPVPLGGTGRMTFPENAIVFGDGGHALKTSSNLYWNNATASLGVRNAVPERALDVSGTIRAEAFEGDGSKVTNVPMGSLSGILPVSAGGTGRTNLAANRLLVGSDEKSIASTSNLYWDNVGMRLGIRTASPEDALDVAGCIRTIDLKVANEIISSASDLRLKQNVQKIERPWDLLDQMSGYTFDWNAEAIDKMDPRHPKQDIGLIAQEIQDVLPSAVYPCAFDSEYMTVKYEKLVPLLIECIKDLRDELRRQMENKF